MHTLSEWPKVELVQGTIICARSGLASHGLGHGLPMFALYPDWKGLYMRYISCSLPIRCLIVAITPCSWIPLMVSLAPTAWRTGSAPKPSQLRPPLGLRPIGPTAGASQMLTPLPRASLPMATARSYMSFLSKVAPTVIPSGNTVTLSAWRTPFAASLRHSWGNPTRSAEPVLPLHRLVKSLALVSSKSQRAYPKRRSVWFWHQRVS